MKSLTEYINERQLGQGWRDEISKDGKYKAVILAFDEPSQYGIDGGRISKLCIYSTRNTGDWYCNYDRGWDVKPKKEIKEFYDEIISKYN